VSSRSEKNRSIAACASSPWSRDWTFRLCLRGLKHTWFHARIRTPTLRNGRSTGSRAIVTVTDDGAAPAALRP